MRIIIDPKEAIQVRVKYNGGVIYDQTLQPGHHDIDVVHPKCCGVAEAFLVDSDGAETPIGSADYGKCGGSCGGKCSGK